MQFTLKMRTHFDAAHFLPKYDGKCKNVHGHRWEVEIVLVSESLDDQNMVADFSTLKKVVDEWDHRQLNDFVHSPTAELLAAALFVKLQGLRIPVQSVEIWEAPNASVKVCSK